MKCNCSSGSVFVTNGTTQFELGGEIERRLDAVIAQWILPAPYSNPDMLEMFREPDRFPLRNRVSWAGEFAGKYLTHAVQIYRLRPTAELRRHLDWFVKELMALQAEDGYLGPWPETFRLTGRAPNAFLTDATWDAWGHYHIMLGMLLWYRCTGNQDVLACVRRIGDLFCEMFLETGKRLVGTGSEEMNLAPIHSLCLLFKETGEERYFAMAREIEKDFEVPPAGDYVRQALAGKEFHETPKPRWESLHPIMGIVELYYISGEEKYKSAFEHLWWSMLKGDRHNNGGFSAGEQATGNPYDSRSIETCCTVAWMAMTVEMLRISGDSTAADELELSMFNSGLGMMNPYGRWVTYNTPMDGVRDASAQTIVFQSRAGSPELNCCSVNGPRALGLLSDWAIMAHDGGVALNYYGPGKIRMPLPSGNNLVIVQDTEYPLENRITATIYLDRPEKFTFLLRIPYWSQDSAVWVNGERVTDVCPGRYLRLERTWSPGNLIVIELDFRPHFWVDETPIPTIDWQAEWRVFGPVANQAHSWDDPERGKDIMPGDKLESMPESLVVDGVTLSPSVVCSRGGRLDFRQLYASEVYKGEAGRLGRLPIAYAFTEIEMEKDGVLSIAFGADWWCCWFVNGVKVFDNHSTGGNAVSAGVRSHKVDLPLRKGKNLIAVRVTSGFGGWSLTVGKVMPEENRSWHTSVYRGPILLTYDPRFNRSLDSIPILDAAGLAVKRVEADSWLPPWMLFELSAGDGSSLRLCDFASAGTAGHAYRSWLPVRFPFRPRAVFSHENPLRSFRVN